MMEPMLHTGIVNTRMVAIRLYIHLNQGAEMTFSVGDSVVLITFLGKKIASDLVRDSNNYWKLIGKRGRVAKKEIQSKMFRHEYGERVLVTFDEDVKNLGLSCHNEIENSLWIFVSDLKPT